MEDNKQDEPKPLTIDEIEREQKPKKRPVGYGFPIAVGHTGWSLGKARTWRTEDGEDIPDSETIGPRNVK